MSKRDPFPFPRFENDYSFTGVQQQQKESYDKPTHIAQTEEPWSRLHDAATFASTRRSIMHYDQQAPNDSLDFHLQSIYDHHKEFLRSKNQTLYQRQTVSEDHGTMKNYKKQEVPQDDLDKEIRMWVNSQKSSIYSIEGTIESHHNASTNRGYSRKHDGGFYSV